jgi:hypothetical protein
MGSRNSIEGESDMMKSECTIGANKLQAKTFCISVRVSVRDIRELEVEFDLVRYLCFVW